MPKTPSLTALWQSAAPQAQSGPPEGWADLPPAARAYLAHAIAPGTPPASAIRLRMHGQIKLNQRWHPFRAAQVIHWPRGMIWQATAWVKGLPVGGADRYLEGRGQMDWRLLGLWPVVQAAGPDIDRSARGRYLAELIWLPAVLGRPEVRWEGLGEERAIAHLEHAGETLPLTLTIAPSGQLTQVHLRRWGSPEGGPFQALDFGAIIAADAQFNGYRIPTRLRVGWYLGSERFTRKGEFFRATLTQATWR